MNIFAIIYFASVILMVGFYFILNKYVKRYCAELKELGYTPVNYVPMIKWEKIKQYSSMVFFSICPILNTFLAILYYAKSKFMVEKAFDLVEYTFGIEKND